MEVIFLFLPDPSALGLQIFLLRLQVHSLLDKVNLLRLQVHPLLRKKARFLGKKRTAAMKDLVARMKTQEGNGNILLNGV